MRKLMYVMIFSLLCLCLPISVRGDWELSDVTGDWNYYSLTQWESPYGSSFSKFSYTCEIDNFQHLGVIVYLENYDVGGYWEISKAHQIVAFGIYNNELDYGIMIIVDHALRIHLLGYKDVLTGAYVLENDYDLIIPSLPVIKNMYVELHIWKRADGNLSVAYMYKYDPNEQKVSVLNEETLKIDPSFYNNLTITLTVEKALEYGAGGYIKGGLLGLSLTSGEGLTQPPYSYEELTMIEITRRNWWILDDLFKIGQFLWNMLSLLWNYVIPNLPIIFSIYIFYLLYLIGVALETGNFGVLFDHFLKIGQFFVTIIQAIYSGVSAILSLFKK